MHIDLSVGGIFMFNVDDTAKLPGTSLASLFPEFATSNWEEEVCAKNGINLELNHSDPHQSNLVALCKGGRIVIEKEHMGYWFKLEQTFLSGASFQHLGEPLTTRLCEVPEAAVQFHYNEGFNRYMQMHSGNAEAEKHYIDSLFRTENQGLDYRSLGSSPVSPKRNPTAAPERGYFHTRVLQSIKSGPYAEELLQIYDGFVAKVCDTV